MRAVKKECTARVVVFDFDGLLVDGLNECILVSWNGFHGKGPEFFGPEGLEAIPAQFKEAFKNHRNFSRHLGHFVSPFYLHEHFTSQAQFDAAFSTIPIAAVDDFVDRANAARQAARDAHYQRWLEYHAFYPGILAMLKSISCPIYIVTGKDAASVDELMRRSGIDVPLERIFGECRDKVAVLKQIASAHDAAPSEVYFFDDNVSNARSAHESGFNAYWATWGYNAPDHWGIARAVDLPEISLDDMVGMKLVAEACA
jgi:HAD superfamily hydrolase (TIGR01509 family)